MKYYLKTFKEYYREIWKNYKKVSMDEAEIESLSFYATMDAFVNNTYEDIEARRELLYHYSNEFDRDGTINDNRHKLPIDTVIDRALNLMCVAYDKAPKRLFSEKKNIQDAYIEIYEKAYVNSILQNIYKLAVLHNLVAVRPINTVDGDIDLLYFTPSQMRLWTKDNQVSKIAYVLYDSETKDNVAEVWTNESVERYTKNGVAEERNPYGQLPFAILNLGNSTEIYTSGMFGLVESNLYINEITYLARLNSIYNGSPIKIARNLGSGKLELGPDKILYADGSHEHEHIPTIDYLTPPPEYENLYDYSLQLQKSEMNKLGVPYSILDNDNNNLLSGISRMIERSELTEKRNSHIPKLQKFERELANKISIINPVRDLKPENFKVQFQEENLYLEPSQEYELDKQKLRDGLISIEQFLDKYSDTDDIETIKKRINQIKNLYEVNNERRTDSEQTDRF